MSTPEPIGLPPAQRRRAAITLRTAMAMSSIDSAIANVALPTIAADLGAPADLAVWVGTAFNLAIVVVLLPMAALADRIGPRRMFAIGITVFGLSSLSCALSPSMGWLIGSRAVQGVGSGMLMCLFGGTMRSIYPPHELARGFSLNAMTVALGSVTGPLIGAALLGVASWPWIFGVNVPICVAALAGVRHLPQPPRHRAPIPPLDVIASATCFASLVIGLDMLLRHPVAAVLLLVLALVSGAVLLRRAAGQLAPMLPLDLLAIARVRYAVVASALTFGAQAGAFIALPFHFEHLHGYRHVDTAMALGAWALTLAVVSPASARMSERFSAARLAGTGASLMAVGLAVLAVLPVGSPLPLAWAAMALGGMGFALFQTPNNREMIGNAPAHRFGAIGGLQALTRELARATGLAITAICLGASAAAGSRIALGAAAVLAAAAAGSNVVRARALREGN